MDSLLKLWEELPSNWRLIKEFDLKMPSSQVVDVFIARLDHFDLIHRPSSSLLHTMFNRDIDVQRHIMTVTLDMTINFGYS